MLCSSSDRQLGPRLPVRLREDGDGQAAQQALAPQPNQSRLEENQLSVEWQAWALGVTAGAFIAQDGSAGIALPAPSTANPFSSKLLITKFKPLIWLLHCKVATITLV